MAGPLPRVIHLVHTSPGRTRLRLPWLRSVPDDATALADGLAAVNGMLETSVRPRTGSVLCQYDADRLDAERIIAAVRRLTRVALVVRPGEEVPAEVAAYERAFLTEESSFARALAKTFRGIDRDVVVATEGRLDLGTLTGLGFLAAGAAEILVTRTLPAPPWFNLAWWAFRTFTMFEHGPTHQPPTHAPRTPARPHAQGAPARRRRPHRTAPSPVKSV